MGSATVVVESASLRVVLGVVESMRFIPIAFLVLILGLVAQVNADELRLTN